MKMRKMLVVLFILVGSNLYADSNETSAGASATTSASETTEVSELERLRYANAKLREENIHLRKTLDIKGGAYRKLRVYADSALDAYKAMADEYEREWDKCFKFEEQNEILKQEVASLKRKLFNFMGD